MSNNNVTTSDHKKEPLRHGWTTGTCAAIAARAAYHALLTGSFPDHVTVRLPKSGTASLPLCRAELHASAACAGVIKDAGDDPDVTHGALVWAEVQPGAPGSGVSFRAGPGVGIVTLPGLPLAVGEPAINPGPRGMIEIAIAEVAREHGGSGDVVVTVGVEGGTELAKRTMNSRLGIIGGLSILGTTGIVVPFSCAAWIHSIHRGIDVARAAAFPHIAAATGNTSEMAVQHLYGLPEAALIDMGDFAGGMLKYLRTHPVPRLSLAGGFGKFAKLAQGHLYLHSSKSRINIPALVADLAAVEAPADILEDAASAETAAQVLAAAGKYSAVLAARIAAEARRVASLVVGDAIAIEVLIYDRAGRLLGRANFE